MFGKLLEAARRYGDDSRKSMEGIAVRGTMFSVLDLEGLAGPHAAEFEGKKTFGVLFEEGCHAVTEGRYALSVNANSLHREAFDAWNQ